MKAILSLCALAILAPLASAVPAVNYDIVYVRQVRFGDTTNTIWPEVFHPARLDPGADLMLLHPNGTEEVLVAGGNGGVTDPFISFDGQWCYYVLFPDLRSNQLNSQRADLPYAGADICRIHLKTRAIQRLTNQEFTPNTGTGNWDVNNPVNPSAAYNRLGYGILNMGPCPVAGGKVAFVSNRRGYVPPNSYTSPTLQLYVMDEDGKNVTPIAPMNIGSALHPVPLADGRIMFSSYESQGLRDQRMWGIWTILPDGRSWAPLVSAYHSGQAFHFMTQLSNGEIVVEDYYNLNNNGFGALYKLPPEPPAGQPQFFSAFSADNPSIARTIGSGLSYSWKMPFTPRGFVSMTPFTHPDDEAAPAGTNGVRKGKFTHPSGAPNNDCLVVWTPGPANDLARPITTPRYDAGLYIIRNGAIVTDPSQLVLIKNDPAYNECWPRAVVPYRDVHGVDEPAKIPWLPNDGSIHPALPKGTPYGLVGTSSFYKRESFPSRGTSGSWNGLDAFNTSENGESSNWEYQGSDAGKYTNSEIFAVRILAMEPNSHRSYGPHLGGPSNDGNHFVSHARERLRILGEIPLRKKKTDGTPVMDTDNNPDTSFLAKIPADTPFTFQTLDKDGLVLNMAQTWHQVRPGEMRANCGGCHAHSQQPLAFESTAAGQTGFQPVDLTTAVTWLSKDANGETIVLQKPAGAVNVEYLRDIRPIFERSCNGCHTKNNATPPGNLVMDDYTMSSSRPGDYSRFASDTSATWGYKPVISNGTWRQTNASRYVRKFQSRRSLLVWKIFGRRLDGWTNADHPTETTSGVASTLPASTNANTADLDYTGDIMPPPGSGYPPLSEDEKMLIARWVDLGCPLNTGTGGDAPYGWFADELPPTLTVSSPRPDKHVAPLMELRIGVADAYTGVQSGSLSVKAGFSVNGAAPGTELAGQGSFVSPGIFVIPLQTPILNLESTTITASVRDVQGNKEERTVRFWVKPPEISLNKCDATELPQHRLTLHVQDDHPNPQHRILATDNLNALIWTDVTLLGSVRQDDRFQYRVEVPPQFAGRCFLRVER